MKLFPHAMIRIGGGTFDKLETLNITDSTKTIEEIFNREKKLDTLKQALSDELYSIIPGLKDPALQNLLVKMKRDIFNGRNIRDEKITMIEGHLPPPRSGKSGTIASSGKRSKTCGNTEKHVSQKRSRPRVNNSKPWRRTITSGKASCWEVNPFTNVSPRISIITIK